MMKCPNCGKQNLDNIDTRDSGERVWRRKRCLECGITFTTYECYIPKGATRRQIYDMYSRRSGEWQKREEIRANNHYGFRSAYGMREQNNN